ncbi:hypothetical protein P175DRAFT_0438753 [Aspergillus ochraceoroseus IBT 24754]|uniref:Amidase domain-containing protein n=2 Tax=Aspergillus ochraceoroseus TaxID=138278 RepID=A0A2T5LVX9_9EURO|nr:uncharacterized protein P175DRAFT_0438753 [Aspergillus ochraceoroseus IBT 24754]KKK24537.1 hypothetical protein AOCH_001619 [Aspergillus ochraceoroseus]PTU20413.1 hypothetical protein P175DRAFT_0438753 [Aspergillus ochraceoroseus IBT 24754]
MTIDWQLKAQRKQEDLEGKIPSEWRVSLELLKKVASLDNILDIPRQTGMLTQREILLTESHDATNLLEQLTTGQVSAVEVATAFCKRAAIAQQLTSCLTEIFFDQAISRAQELDRQFAETGKPVGPLHGLPISLKDSYSVKGVQTTLGYISFLDRPALTFNSPMVEILLAAGAVIYVKTNLPQTMMTCDSQNNVFGRTRNPYSRLLTPGGSCGGEGALLAMRGSIMGVGTDVAGSIRIPSFCCGTVGFKPSVGRLPFAGQTPPGRVTAGGLIPCSGPLCVSTRDADLFFRTVVSSKPENLDENSLGFPYIEPPPAKPQLTIGILPEDTAFPLHPCMLRTIRNAAQKLAVSGHHVVNLSTDDIPSLADVYKLAHQFFNMDPDNIALRNVTDGGEPFIPSLSIIYDTEHPGPEPTLRQLYDLNMSKFHVCAKMRQACVSKGLDVILAPAYQSCAPLHDSYGGSPYTVVWNLVDYPACVIPFGRAEEAADAEFVRDVVYKPEYKPKEIEGMPCHLQLVGRRLKDEILLQNARLIEEILNQGK